MASSKKGDASLIRRWESAGVKGSSSTPSGSGINRRNRVVSTADLATILDLRFELETKGVKGSSSGASNERNRVAAIVKGEF